MEHRMWKMIIVLAVIFFATKTDARDRIFWLESYHSGNQWTDALTLAIQSTLEGHDIELRVFHMDTKRNQSKSKILRASKEAADAINAYKPKVLIASDDNASKYVVAPYFKNSSLPVVFCGVNHSAERYGYPYRNTTGIIELDPVSKLIYSLSRFQPITHVGYLAEDSNSAHLNGKAYKAQTRITCTERYVSTFQEWQNAFREMQKEVDAVIIGNTTAIKSWDRDKAIAFAINETKKPTGCLLDFLADLAFIGCIKVPEEQGRWAAESALKILNGTPADSIPIAKPNEFKLIVNMKIANASNFKVPRSYINRADLIID